MKTTPGAIRCLQCGQPYNEPPPGWECTVCLGPVSQNMGTVVIPPDLHPELPPDFSCEPEPLL